MTTGKDPNESNADARYSRYSSPTDYLLSTLDEGDKLERIFPRSSVISSIHDDIGVGRFSSHISDRSLIN